MFIKFNDQLFNMNNINTAYWSERHEDDESDPPVITGYWIRLIDIHGEPIATKSYSVNQVKQWEKEYLRVERWLLGYR